jgi:hypothetical protein
MRRCRNVGVAILGLLVVAAISMAAGSGRKPPKEQGTTVSLRRISGDEVVQILRRFPEMVPDYLASKKNDDAYLARVFRFSEVTTTALERVFPAARFYRGLDMALPPHAYLMVINGDRRYMMPGDFNRLLLDNGMDVTDKNIVELAKAFVVLALGDQGTGLLSYPQIAFLDAGRVRQELSQITYDAKLKVRIGEQLEIWYFASWRGQLGLVSRGTADGKLIMQYDIPRAESPLQRGQLDVTPSIGISDSAPSKAYLVWQSGIPHYYLTVDTNLVADSFKVRFLLSGFPANATNVHVRVTDSIRNGAVRLLDTVHININGDGYYDWTPRDDSTGICKVQADTLGLDSVYRNATGRQKELTLERVKDTTFPVFRGHHT